MKIRPSILGFISVVVLLLALLLWHQKKNPTEIALTTSVKTNVASTTIPIPSKSMVKPIQTNMSVPAASIVPPSSQNHKWEQMQPGLALNDQPIVFYGKVEDQFGDAVANATVTFSIGARNGHESTEKRGQVTTDGNGFFTITGYKGYDLGVMPEKAGYVLATTGTLFKYSHLERHPYVSDPNNPTAIRMWKLQGGEHLISFNFETYVQVDGTSATYDLKTGRRVESGGDLTIRITSSVNPSVAVGYDWQASIQMVAGGIIQDSSGLGLQKMFQAPDSGYAPEFDLSFKKGTQSWTPRYNTDFYFTSQGDKYYGKMWLEQIK